MKYLSQNVDIRSFFKKVETASQRVLLLDYDGTLAPFVIDRNKAVPYPQARELIKDIIALDRSRVVIVSGRAIKDLRPLLQLEPPPEIWGSHGSERLLPDGEYSVSTPNPTSSKKLALAREYLTSLNLSGEIEDKPVGLAVHWRAKSERDKLTIRESVGKAWEDIIKDSDLEIHAFDGGLEMRDRRRDKGMAVTEILSTSDDEAAVAYLGDDKTDEDAFKVLKGKGLRVLVRSEFRETLADIWITPPGEMITFLSNWKNACRGGQPYPL